jgi:hypothetical protein
MNGQGKEKIVHLIADSCKRTFLRNAMTPLFQFLGEIIMMQTVMMQAIIMMNIQISKVVQRNTAVILPPTVHLLTHVLAVTKSKDFLMVNLCLAESETIKKSVSYNKQVNDHICFIDDTNWDGYFPSIIKLKMYHQNI